MSGNKEMEIYSNSKDDADERIARMEQRMIKENINVGCDGVAIDEVVRNEQ